LKSGQFKLEKWTRFDTFLDQEECMDQIHKRFTDDQVKNLFKGYCQSLLDRADIGKKDDCPLFCPVLGKLTRESLSVTNYLNV